MIFIKILTPPTYMYVMQSSITINFLLEQVIEILISVENTPVLLTV